MQQPPQNPGQSPRVQVELPANLNAIYANGVVISQMHSEIVMDFIQLLPNDPRARVQTRIVMTPANAKLFMQALQQNLARFEAIHGEIKTPPPQATLADQLFGQARPSDDDPKDGQP
jgi:hypothetical protein